MPKSFLLLLAFVAAAASAAETRDLVVDTAHSPVTVAVKATGDSFTARLADYTVAAKVAPGETRFDSLTLRFHFADLHTGKDGRDKKMREWLQTERFPDATFTLGVLAPQADGRYTATGQLAIHGVTREVTFPVTIKADHGQYVIDGSATLDTQTFGLPIIKVMAFLKVDPSIHVSFHLQGSVAP